MKQPYLFILSISIWCGCTQKIDGREKYREDVHYFFQTIRELHAAPYTRISKDSFDFLEKEILEECNQMKNVKDLNVALMRCNQYFDGHTVCGILPTLYTLMPALKLPIEVRNDSIFWQPTKEFIVSLDTFPASSYLADVKDFVSYDLALKNKNAAYTKRSFFYLLNNFKSPRYIDLLNIKTQNKRRLIINNQMDIIPDATSRLAAYDFKYYPEDSIAVFQYNTSIIENFEQFQDSLQSFFDRIEKSSIKYLFIDVRRNGGGSDIVHQPIYNHVQFKANGIKYEQKWTSRGKRMVLKKMLEASYVKGQKRQMWKELIQTYWETDKIIKKDSFVWESHSGYDKDIFILQGENTFSSAYNFCWVMRLANPNCLLVGTTVGQSNPIFGNMIRVQLPNTKIPFTIATSRNLYKYNLSQKNGFLNPDIDYSFKYKDTVTLRELKQIIELKYLYHVQIK